jgi:precorrin-3B methylase
MAHKKNRRINLGDHVTLIFEDELTIRYQVQEMLRIEKIFEEQDIIQELEAYTSLIPDGNNWKATMMIEYTDPIERAAKLAILVGVEQNVCLTVVGHTPVYPIADEDLERDTEDKTSAVHFLRFELTQPMIQALQHGAALSASVDHPNYQAAINNVDAATRDSLLNDLK